MHFSGAQIVWLMRRQSSIGTNWASGRIWQTSCGAPAAGGRSMRQAFEPQSRQLS